jgi:hypothetical protein
MADVSDTTAEAEADRTQQPRTGSMCKLSATERGGRLPRHVRRRGSHQGLHVPASIAAAVMVRVSLPLC